MIVCLMTNERGKGESNCDSTRSMKCANTWGKVSNKRKGGVVRAQKESGGRIWRDKLDKTNQECEKGGEVRRRGWEVSCSNKNRERADLKNREDEKS